MGERPTVLACRRRNWQHRGWRSWRSWRYVGAGGGSGTARATAGLTASGLSASGLAASGWHRDWALAASGLAASGLAASRLVRRELAAAELAVELATADLAWWRRRSLAKDGRELVAAHSQQSSASGDWVANACSFKPRQIGELCFKFIYLHTLASSSLACLR